MTPIEFAAIVDLQRALQAIDSHDGYYKTVAADAVKLDPNSHVERYRSGDGPRPMIFIEFDEDQEFDYDPSDLRIKLPIIVNYVDNCDGADDTALLLRFFEACADVEKAVNVDMSRGGRASDTRITKRRMSFEGTQLWVEIEMKLWIRRQYGQPSEA